LQHEFSWMVWTSSSIGGGCAGTAAAVGAAKAGAQTLLVESGPVSGGSGHAEKMSLTYCVFLRNTRRAGCFGVADQVLNGYVRLGAVSEPISFTEWPFSSNPSP